MQLFSSNPSKKDFSGVYFLLDTVLGMIFSLGFIQLLYVLPSEFTANLGLDGILLFGFIGAMIAVFFFNLFFHTVTFKRYPVSAFFLFAWTLIGSALGTVCMILLMLKFLGQ